MPLIAATAIVCEGVVFEGDAVVEDFVIIGKPKQPGQAPVKTRIGAGAHLRSHTVIYAGNRIGRNFQTGHGALVREDNIIGDDCSLGSGSVIEFATRLGNRVRIHSQAFVPEYSVLGDECWLGPNCVLTNADYPASPTTKQHLAGVTVERGARIGANATILAGVVIGEQALVGAGAVVVKDVLARTVVAGNPARVLRRVDELRYADGTAVYPAADSS